MCGRESCPACRVDHYQEQCYEDWYRHITLAMAAHAYLTAQRADELANGDAEADQPDSSCSASPNSGA